MNRYKVVLGHILNPISDKKCEYIPNGAMILKLSKRDRQEVYLIDQIGPAKKILKNFEQVAKIIDFSDSVIMPGFFDMHFHWVQDDVREMPKDSLLEWLEKYTFPTEAKYKNKKYTYNKAKSFFSKLIKMGTLGGACYGSIHEHSVEYGLEKVIGDFTMGNVLMTMNSPKYLTQSKKEAISSVKKLGKKHGAKYAVTPRFAITTDPETMQKAAKIGKANRNFIQTHLSETPAEIESVLDIYHSIKGFEKVKTYTDIYKKVGMLSSKTIMGHGIYLSKRELGLLAKSKTAVAHCPTSNAPIKEKGLGSGLFDFKRTERLGVRWALASDIGGGPYLSMFDVMGSFVRQNSKAKVKGATYTKALYRSTMAGAEILKVSHKAGNLLPGKDANFIIVDLPKKLKTSNKSAESILELIISKHSKKRKNYSKLVNHVFYQGFKY